MALAPLLILALISTFWRENVVSTDSRTPSEIMTIVTIVMLAVISITQALLPQSPFSRRPYQLHSQVTPVSMFFQQPSTPTIYHPPRWVVGKLCNLPTHGRLHLANLPTPIHLVGSKVKSSSKSILGRLDELNIKLYIKRDDATGGVELGGNKVRKLEFLLADALAKNCDSIVTIGGEQSNHCRATAAASRMVGLSPHIVLRTERADAIYKKNDDIGWTGNILFDRMVGGTIYTCTPGEYGRIGSHKLVQGVCNYLKDIAKSQKNPYPIPVGGSNGLGSWGYINAVDELMTQLQTINIMSPDFAINHVVFATGSGGTAAGIALGLSLAYGRLGDGHPAFIGKHIPSVHAVGVCDFPNYFYNTMSGLADEMGISLPAGVTTDQFIRESVTVHQGKGRGYALSSEEELDFITNFSHETGIILDPVYSGKALFHFLQNVVENSPNSYKNTNILFWHTGGVIGLYEKGKDLIGRLNNISQVKRVNIYGKKHMSPDVVEIL